MECSTSEDVLRLAQLLEKCEDFKVAFQTLKVASKVSQKLKGDPTPLDLGG